MQALQLIKNYLTGAEVNVKGTPGGTPISISQQRVWTAKGYGWQTMAVVAVASLIVRPTTLSIITLYNNTGKNFVIERLFTHNLVSIADGNFSLWACLHPVGAIAVDTPTNDITIRNSLSGLTAGTEGLVDVEAAVVDDGWFPWGMWGTTVTATMPGTVVTAEVNGRLVIPPTAALSLSAVAQTAVVTQAMGYMWYSVPVSEFAVGT